MITITQTGPEGILHDWKNDIYKILNLCTVNQSIRYNPVINQILLKEEDQIHSITQEEANI